MFFIWYSKFFIPLSNESLPLYLSAFIVTFITTISGYISPTLEEGKASEVYIDPATDEVKWDPTMQ